MVRGDAGIHLKGLPAANGKGNKESRRGKKKHNLDGRRFQSENFHRLFTKLLPVFSL